MQTHAHRRYTMSAAALEQRKGAQKRRTYRKGLRPSRKGVTIGLHITPQAAAILGAYRQGRPRRAFLTAAILGKAGRRDVAEG